MVPVLKSDFFLPGQKNWSESIQFNATLLKCSWDNGTGRGWEFGGLHIFMNKFGIPQWPFYNYVLGENAACESRFSLFHACVSCIIPTLR